MHETNPNQRYDGLKNLGRNRFERILGLLSLSQEEIPNHYIRKLLCVIGKCGSPHFTWNEVEFDLFKLMAAPTFLPE